ncbi:restriction endonuclease subunit S [Pseudomonas aeruginosa]|uniref:restriction endonuclease subunit S n=1 Tax=Pseudomonas aeruginosa TaxID=287 RepID=UPI0009A3F9D7|nr:restriction endonuclease subunit S [Pseudomonas aeruginosa]MCR3807399.1 restriction endonuclease subunit S [Pseudomonas aeruginosa]MCS8030117.1 restriction endonuclease subunit S [Pseudomonas aeruginosa]MCT5698498.1 restriction endonuclease subunit S [Pseudomonas aeruginosa]MCT5814737.1 restriction endonuclease subunit S [Pseudomonas aeruginosa]MDI4041896.1 restriction endonuclease subunit S [Pseudomonas aeruginosa]
MSSEWVSFTDLLSAIVDNRGRTCPVGEAGLPLIATNCIDPNTLYPRYETTRYVSDETYKTWFRGHPKPGDILFVCKGSPGRTNWVPDPVDFCIAQDMVAVRADPQKIYPKYLFAALRSSVVQSQIDNMHVGTMIPHFKKGDFGKLKIPVLRSDAQKVIGDFYFTVSERITLLRETNATLEAIAQALFKSWFVDFDPVRAKAEGRQPEGMDATTAALFPDSFEESEMGLVPKGWSHSTVGLSFVLTMGQSPPGDTYNEVGEGLPFYQGRTDFGFRFPKQRIFCTEPTRLAGAGDTLVSVRAPVGDVNIALEACALGRGVAGLRHPEGHQSFVFYAVRCLKPHFEMYDGEGTVFGSINKKDFQSLPVVVPTTEVLSAFEVVVAPLDAAVENNEQKLRSLTQLRDTLLPRLISGQLRLPEAEALLEDNL